MSQTLRIASTQISLSPITRASEYWLRIEKILKDATEYRCHAVLFPEYACLSLLVHGHSNTIPFQTRLKHFATQGYREYEQHLSELSQRFDIAIIGGTYPVQVDNQRLVNRCVVARPKTTMLFQDKLNMTRFEKEEWGISPPVTSHLRIFDLNGVSAAVAICYDVEFPVVSTAAAQAGVELLFVPSCTDTRHGYWRVRHCAQARTIENPCFVALASIIDGDTRFSEMDSHDGRAAVLSPCDGPFPERGILAECPNDLEGLIWADLNFDTLREIRKNGSVLNLSDQSKQKEVQILDLRKEPE